MSKLIRIEMRIPYREMKMKTLLAAVTQLRAMWAQQPNDPHPLEIRGSRFSVKGSVCSSMTRLEIAEQCERLEAGMQAHHDEVAAESIEPRNWVMAQWPDIHNYTRLISALSRQPRAVRMQALAFHGLTDADMVQP